MKCISNEYMLIIFEVNVASIEWRCKAIVFTINLFTPILSYHKNRLLKKNAPTQCPFDIVLIKNKL